MRSPSSKRNRKKRDPARALPQASVAVPAPEAASAAASGDLQEAFARRVTAERAEALSRVLEDTEQGRGDRGVERLCHVMEESYALFDDLLAEMDLDPPLACRRGCSFCCCNQISLTPPEAILLGLHLLETHRGPALERVEARVRTTLERIHGKSRAEIGLIRHLLPCPFLEDGACSVHPARPLVCRGWNAVDAEQCRRANDLQDPWTMIENHALPRVLAEAIQLGLLQASRAHGLEAGFLVVTRAARLMLEHGVGECAVDWLGGRPFFGRKISW